jgi:hypothetical protein
MKTKIVIEVETKPILFVLPEEGKGEDEFTEEELSNCREEFTQDVHSIIVNLIQIYADEQVKNDFLDSENYVEGYEKFENYNTTIKIKTETK